MKPERKAERRAIKRAARKAETSGIDAAVRYAGHRAPDARKSRLERGIVEQLRKQQGE